MGTERTRAMLTALTRGTYESVISIPTVPGVVRPFLRNSFDAIQAGPVETAACFTFGRETIIPKMFVKILEQAPASPEIQGFKTYLERHIELDGDSHGPLALNLISELCEDDQEKWERATQAAKSAIQARIDLYSTIEEKLSS